MKTIILFPSLYNNLKKVDECFELEYNACNSVNMDYAFFDHDEFCSDGKFKTTLKRTYRENTQIILRGWMLTDIQYRNLQEQLRIRNCTIINNELEYIHCHYFPNVYKDIRNFTVPTVAIFHLDDMTDTLIEKIQDTITTDIIIKDYVKSEKGTDLFRIKLKDAKTNLKDIITRFVEQRQPLFNKGIVLKEFVELKKYNGITNEWRAFFLNHKLISLKLNSEQKINENQPDSGFLTEVANNIVGSNFFTIDVAEMEVGSWKVLEAGDGQVSGLSPFDNELVYYSNIKNYLKLENTQR